MIQDDKKKRRKRNIIIVGVMIIVLMLFGCLNSSKDDNAMKISDVGELDGQVIALLDGASYDGDIQKIFPDATLKFYPTYVDCIMAVKSGKAAAYITEQPIADSHIEESGGLTYFSEPLLEEKYVFMMNKDNTELQKEINQVLAQFEEEGVLDELRKEWIDKEGVQSVDRDSDADNSKGTIKVITSSDAKPFCYVENGEIVGYEVELIVKIAERLGYEIEITVAEFSAFMPSIVEGKMDIAFSCVSATPEREKAVCFSDVESRSSVVAVIASDEAENKDFWISMKDSFYRTFIKESRWKLLRDGLFVTVQISVVSLILGTVLGVLASFPLRSKNTIIRRIANGVSMFLDGMPLVVILMLLYYIVFKSIDISPVWIGIIGFTIDFANVVAGLLNTGVEAVDNGQQEAAVAMGYNNMQVFWKIIFPQAVRYMFSQYEGAVGGLIKGTAIVGYITIEDLTKAGDIIRSRTYEAFFPLIVTAVLYFVISYLFVALLKCANKKLDPKRRSRKVKGVQTSDND